MSKGDETAAMRRALFLDRDGVVNEDLGYVHRREDFHLLPGVFETCRAGLARGLRPVIVTNQSGIGRGLYGEAAFRALMGWVAGRFAAEGVPLLDVYFCPADPRTPTGAADPRRKPAPGMLLEAASAHGLDLAASAMLGDRATDMAAGRAAGVRALGLLGAAPAELAAAGPGVVALADHAAAAEWLAAL